MPKSKMRSASIRAVKVTYASPFQQGVYAEAKKIAKRLGEKSLYNVRVFDAMRKLKTYSKMPKSVNGKLPYWFRGAIYWSQRAARGGAPSTKGEQFTVLHANQIRMNQPD